MCKEKYINIQTGEELDWDRVSVLKDNSLLKKAPEFFVEWNFDKNKDKFDVYSITYRNGNKVWWIGNECGHEWETSVANRTVGKNCPYCNKNNPKTLKGFNDLWTTDPEIAIKLENHEEGYLYSKRSDVIVNWKCPDCNNVIKRAIKDATRRGVNCQRCTDGISFGEKVIYNLLKDSDIKFDYDKATDYSENKRYDFYLPDYKTIIEIHGSQHTKQATGIFGENRSLDIEIENDKFKKNIAILNGISSYIELHITDNNIEEISEKVINSGLLKILDLKYVDWTELLLKSQKSLVLLVCKYYKENHTINTGELAIIFSLTRSTIIKYLKIGNSLGLCNYVKYNRPYNYKNSTIYNSRAVVQLSLSDEYINEYKNISEAFKITKCNNISAVCRGKLKKAGGFKWMYLEDYEKEYGKLS